MTVMSQSMQILTSHKVEDWYTPSDIIKMVREVLGTIDLDPASDRIAQSRIQARYYYNKVSNGLLSSWQAETVFLNPPYGKTGGKSNQALWSKLMADRYSAGSFRRGILLINSTHGYKWYEDLWIHYPVCLARERIRFIKPDGTQGGQAKRGQTFVYFGQDATKFTEVFSRIGRAICPSAVR